jgi:hypothetical protein
MKPFPLCLSPLKFRDSNGFRSGFGRIVVVTGSGVFGKAVGVIAANICRVVFSASSTCVFFAS